MPTSDIAEVLYVDYGNTGRVRAALHSTGCMETGFNIEFLFL